MKAYILAAGTGTRLYPITQNRPKCLVRVSGKPILQYQIEAYLAAGLEPRNIHVVAGFEADQIIQHVKQKYPGVTVVNNEEYGTTNNMFSLHMALSADAGHFDSPVLISNGDCIYEADVIKGLVSYQRQDLIAAERGIHNHESMKITVESGRVTRISKETVPEESWGVSIDLYYLSPESVQQLYDIMTDYIETRKERKLWTEVALQDLLGSAEIAPFDIGVNRWVEIDNLDDLVMADKLFSDFSPGSKKCFVVDLDGTVYLGSTPFPDAVEFINSNSSEKYFYFLTNNTSKAPTDYVEKLGGMGIEVKATQILSPFIPLVDHLRINNITRLFAVGNTAFKTYLKSQLPGIEYSDAEKTCQAVVVAYDTELTYEKLSTASLLLQSTGIKLIATHCDKVCPTEKGPIPDIGSFLALIETATGRAPDIVFGKPNPSMLDEVKSKFAPAEIAMVGDRLYTDKVLAENAGVDFVLVLSGETKRADVEDVELFPRLILSSLGELNGLE